MTGRRRDARVIPELKAFDCADHDPIDEWVPSDDSVFYGLTLHIGPMGDERRDLWAVVVCTPQGLSRAKQCGAQFGPEPVVVVQPYSWISVLNEVERRLRSCIGTNWIDVQEKLRRQFHWEYEGM